MLPASKFVLLQLQIQFVSVAGVKQITGIDYHLASAMPEQDNMPEQDKTNTDTDNTRQ